MLRRDKYTHDEAIRVMIDKQLEKYGIDYNYVKENNSRFKEETGKEWFQCYTFDTPEEFESWKAFCIDILKNKLRPHGLGNKGAEREFWWINFSFGLTQAYLESNNEVKQ